MVASKGAELLKIAKEKNVDLIFFAINKIDAVSRKKILEICQETGVKTRVLPTTLEVIAKQGAMNSLRDVQIEDLLGRDPVHLDNKNINSLIKNKTVLVTGGGGSIGSELCRQIDYLIFVKTFFINLLYYFFVWQTSENDIFFKKLYLFHFFYDKIQL